MDLEDKIAAIIKEIYDATGFEDEGRSDQAAHEILALLKIEWESVLDEALKDEQGEATQ